MWFAWSRVPEEFELTKDVLDYIRHLKTPKARQRAMEVVGKMEWRKCSQDVHYWLNPAKHADIPFVFTLDNHPLYECQLCPSDFVVPCHFNKRGIHLEKFHHLKLRTEQELKGKFKELPTTRPFTVFPYMPPLIDTWLSYPLIGVEKSRDMMATWLYVTLYTWDTLFHEGRQNIFQSKDANDTCELVKRAWFIYNNQPRFLKNVHPAIFTLGSTKSGVLTIPSLNSEILGFPQGPDQIRQYHPSGVYTDETAFQVYAEEGFASISPAIRAGGRYTGVSTANPSWFMKACRDTTDGTGGE